MTVAVSCRRICARILKRLDLRVWAVLGVDLDKLRKLDVPRLFWRWFDSGTCAEEAVVIVRSRARVTET